MIATSLTAIAMACAGAVALTGLVGRAAAADRRLKLDRHRSTEEGLSDLLNYAACVDDGVVVDKDGSFIACWLYRCPDHASSTDEERNAVALHFSKAIAPLGAGWVLNVDAVRREASVYPQPALSSFPDRVSAAIDQERRLQFHQPHAAFTGYLVISLTWLPPLLIARKLGELMFDDESGEPTAKERTRELIDDFKRHIRAIENRLSSTLALSRLQGRKVVNEDGSTSIHDDQLSWLQYCITGDAHPVVLPRNPAYLDVLLGGQDFEPGSIARIGRRYISTVAIEGFPLESWPGMLQTLAELPSHYRWSNRFIFMDQHDALAHLERFRKKWKQKIRGFLDQMFNTTFTGTDLDAVNMTADAEAAKAEVSSGLVAEGFYTSVVVLMDEDRDRLEDSALDLAKAIRKLGFEARVEEANNTDAFFGTLPGHVVQNVRRPLVNTMNLADFLPTSSIWSGSATAPCPLYPKRSPALMQCVTHGRTIFNFNLHVRDLGHCLMIGPTRNGKSTHVGMIAAQAFRYEGMRVYIFEKGLSAYPITKALGGQHFVLGDEAADSKAPLQFKPLQFLDKPADRVWAGRWIETLLELNGHAVTADQRSLIRAAIRSIHDNGLPRTFSQFFTLVQDNAVRTALHVYTADGPMGYLFDAEDDTLTLSRLATFELAELMEMGDKYAVPVLLYLFRRIERSLRGQPTLIILDEAWLMLEHPLFRAWIRKWLKTLAKLNCAVLPSTQNLSDASNSGIFDVIVESTATKVLLPNARALDSAELYHRIGLNDRQIDILSKAIPKQQYYYMSEQGCRLYELGLGPLALSFVGATDLDSINAIKALEDQHGEQWVDHWLACRGLKLDDYPAEAA